MIRDAWLNRLIFGLRKPRDTRLGRDVAGQVEAVGKNVTQFKPGDEVFGICRGALAEYSVTLERALAIKPANVTFAQAASIPLAGLTALQGLREGKIQPRQKVLINGATGGVGTFAVQIAKSSGAEVTAVCSTRNGDLVRSIGADHVIDYTKEDFTKNDQRYDVIFDNVCNHSFFERRRVLTAKGICVLAGIGGAGVKGSQAIGRILGNLFIVRGLSLFTDQKFAQYITKVSKPDLIILGDLVQTGKVSTGHRSDLQIERDRGGSAVSGRRTRTRENRHQRRMTTHTIDPTQRTAVKVAGFRGRPASAWSRPLGACSALSFFSFIRPSPDRLMRIGSIRR